MAHLNIYKNLIQHFRISVAMATNQNEEFVQCVYAWLRTTQQMFLIKFCQNTYHETVMKADFHFPHYKSVETVSCHSNQSA